MLISRAALRSTALAICFGYAAAMPCFSQDILINSAAQALRDANRRSAEELYNQYLFNESIVALPDGFEASPPDAIQQTARVIDFFETAVAASFGSVVNEHVAEYASIYDRSARDATSSNIAVEIIAAPFEVMISPDPRTVLLARPLSAGKMWASGQLQEKYYRNKALTEFRERLEKDPAVLEEYEAALERNRARAQQLLNSLNALETKAKSDPNPAGMPNSGTRRLAEDVANITNPEQLDAIAEAVERGDYGPALDEDTAADFVESAKQYVEIAQDVSVKAAQTQEIAQNLGVDIPEEINTAIAIGSGLTATATALLDQRYFSAAVSVSRLIGPKRPDPAQERFKAIMKAIGQIDRRLGRIERTQQEILEINQRIEEKVDTLQWTMEQGHQRLELSIQQSAERIIEQIRLVDDRALGRCIIAKEMADAVLFPVQREENVSLFDDPNSNTLSSVVAAQFSKHSDNVVQDRLDYLSARLVDDLPVCLSALRDVLGGLQAGRGIDLHLHLSVFRRLKDEKAVGEESTDADLDALIKTTAAFREKIFEPQLDYLRHAVMRNLTPARSDPVYRDKVLAFNALRAPVGVLGSKDHSLKIPSSEELFHLERYFKGQVDKVIVSPLAAASVHDVARIIAELHTIIGLQGEIAADGHRPLTLESPTTESQELALRMLLQSLQTLDVLRGQQAVIDGRALLSFLEADLKSGDKARWEDAARILKANSQVRTNFVRYLLNKGYRDAGLDLTAYGVAIDAADVGFLQSDLRTILPKPLSVAVSCADSPGQSTCPSKTSYNGPVSPFQITVQHDALSDIEPLVMTLPASWAMNGLSFQWNSTGKETNRLHSALQVEVAGYHIPTLFSEANGLPSVMSGSVETEGFEQLYRSLKLIRMGFDIGSLAEQVEKQIRSAIDDGEP